MDRKTGILFLCDEIIQATAGSEQHLSFLLWNIPRDAFEIFFVILRKHCEIPPDFSPVQPHILNFNSFKSPFEFYRVICRVRRLIQERNIEVVHTFFPDSEIVGALASLGIRKCKVVHARRDLGYEKKSTFKLKRKFLKFLPGHYLANCHAVKNELIKKERVASDKISTIFNPVNQKRILTGETLHRNLLGINNNQSVVGIVANIRPVKDYETFLRAAILVSEKVPSVKFLVIGSKTNDYWQKLRPIAESSMLKNRIILAGPIANPLPIVRLFDVGVLSSTSEGFSNSLVEYAAAGVAAVATDVGGNREIVQDGVTGYLVPPRAPEQFAAKIVDLLTNEDKCKNFGRKAQEYAIAKFNQENILKQYEKYYRSLSK